MLTGRPPFKGPNVMETLRQVVDEEVVPPSRLQSRVLRDLETICLKCLAKEPSKRYVSADALADDLRRYLASQTILARRTPVGERGGLKWARRRPTAATLLVLGVVAVLGLAGAALQYDHAARDKERLENKRVTALRMESLDALFKGRDTLARKEWTNGQLILSKLLTSSFPEFSRHNCIDV